MSPGTALRVEARRWRGPRHPTVPAYVHRVDRAAWLDLAAHLGSPVTPKSLLAQLRRAHQRLPGWIEVVGVDLTGLTEISMDLAVLLCLEGRMLRVRGIDLAVVVRHDVRAPESAVQMLQRFQIWPVEGPRLDELVRAAAQARRGQGGWTSLPEGRVASAPGQGA
ncbi:MAG: hypothetical protein ABF306_15530 [Nocardioides marinisabuli]|uniref:hypothetical protein n=1 Tax=Nocardioides marinisabuli TaxID=419476 RepID=UPI00321A652A